LASSIPSTIGQLTALQYLYVFVLTIQRRSSRFTLRTQVPSQKPVDRLDSVDDWTIDGASVLVRVRVDCYGVGAHASRFARRYLYENKLASSIPPTIGQLTALQYLYVFLLTIAVSELTLLALVGVRRYFHFNELTSSIPSTIGQLTALTVLYVFVLTIAVSELTLLASHAGIFTTTT
jgi:hypothetical protein